MFPALSSKFQVPSSKRNGQTALSVIFVIGGLLVFAAISLAFLVLSLINSGYGYRSANQALALAQAGVNDALLVLTRNKDFSGSYVLPANDYSVTVTVTQSSGRATILSDVTVARYERKLQAVAAVNPVTGQVDLLSWSVLSL